MTAATHEHASPHGYIHRKDDYLKRLRRIEGQARGLQKMVEDEKYCIDILTQVSAMTKALQSVALGLLDEHLSHCVVQYLVDVAVAMVVRGRTRRSVRLPRRSPGWSAPNRPLPQDPQGAVRPHTRPVESVNGATFNLGRSPRP